MHKVVSAKVDKLRIIDLTSMWSGPYCTRLFADEGAEVIKVEAPFRPDGIRANEDDQAPFFKELNRNKLSVTLDLNNEVDREVFLQLLKNSDVVVDNFSPRVMENLQLTKEVLWRYNPQLIIISMSAFGATGPYRNYIGYGPTLECMAGVASLTKTSNGESYLPGFSISDMLAGIHSAFGLLCALYARKRGGSGIKLDISQYETICQVVGNELSGGTRRESALRKLDLQAFLTTIEDYPPAKIKLSDGSETIGLPWGDIGGKRKNKKAPCFGEHNSLLNDWQTKEKNIKRRDGGE